MTFESIQPTDKVMPMFYNELNILFLRQRYQFGKESYYIFKYQVVGI